MKGLIRVSDARANAQGAALRSQLEQQHTGQTGTMGEPIDAHRSLTERYMREYERLQVRRLSKNQAWLLERWASPRRGLRRTMHAVDWMTQIMRQRRYGR
jgi:hypothetical protein